MSNQSEHQLVDDQIVEPGTYGIGEVLAGQRLRITDVQGKQVADFTSYSLDDPSNHCDVIYSMLAKWSWKVGEVGDVLYTRSMDPLWTVVEDTSPGIHYSGGSFCSRVFNESIGLDQHGCRDTIEEAMATRGLDPIYVSPAACFNFFMNFPYKPDGTWEILEPESTAGDYVELRAEQDVLWAVSCCHYPGPCNGNRPTPLRFQTYAANQTG